MLDNIKILLGITDTSKDNLLQLLITQITAELINKTHNPDTDNMSSLICKMVIYHYNRLGTEGVKSESFSGTSYSYTSDYPQDILTEINSFRKIRVI